MAKILSDARFVLFLLVVIFLLHVFALLFHWYITVSWFDNGHHFLGGFWAASLYLYLAKAYPRCAGTGSSLLSILLATLAFAAFLGVAWEFYEFGFDLWTAARGIPFHAQPGLADTMSDLFFDLFGGGVLAVLYWSAVRRMNR